MHKVSSHPYADITQTIHPDMLLSIFSAFLTYADEG